MAISLQITDIVVEAKRVLVRFSDGVELEFGSRDEAVQYAREQLDREALRAIAVAMIITRFPNLTAANIAAIRGKALTVDLTQASWGVVA
jgi:hypothetical protein